MNNDLRLFQRNSYMRKLLILLFTIGFSSFSFAQFNVYHHFPDSNAIWGETYSIGSCGCGYNSYIYNYVLKGDTIVNGLTYRKVYKNDGYIIQDCTCLGPYAVLWEGDTYFYGAYREDTMKHIYMCCTYDLGSKDTLLYDFNLKVGDTLHQYNVSHYYSQPDRVFSIDSTLVGGVYRKRFNIEVANDTLLWSIPSIIEGIGSTHGLFAPMTIPFEGGTYLNCFSQNGKTIWPYPVTDSCGLYYLGVPALQQNKPVITIYPNPSKGLFTFDISSDNYQPIKAVEVYNVWGEKVFTGTLRSTQGDNSINLSNQPNGVYFYRITGENENLIGEGKLVIQK